MLCAILPELIDIPFRHSRRMFLLAGWSFYQGVWIIIPSILITSQIHIKTSVKIKAKEIIIFLVKMGQTNLRLAEQIHNKIN